jgi:hypothetical protein
MMRRFTQPILCLCLLLQRTPAVRLAFASGLVGMQRVVSLLPTAAALGAALGGMHTLAGATQFVTTAENVSGPVGTRILPVIFTLTGAPTPVLSFRVSGGSLPPGLSIDGEVGGIINTPNGTVRIGGTPTLAGTYSISFDAHAEFNGTSSTFGTLTINFTFADLPAPVVAASPGASGIILTVTNTPSPGPSYHWLRNGQPVPNATGPQLTLSNIEPATAGLYAVVAENAASRVSSEAAIIGASGTGKVIGAGVEVGANIAHANGNTFDQVLLHGAAEAITSDFALGQVTRTSFIDLTDDIVQVEFSGPGTLSLVLDGASGPDLPANYNQAVSYMKGHAGIVIVGATKDTNVSVFSVGRKTAVNEALFKEAVSYDGIADIAFIAIASADGEFGSVRAANVNFFATNGLTGLYAPGVTFNGPVYVGDISATEAASPVLVMAAARGETLITGGDLLQLNTQRLTTSGLTRLRFAPGSDSHGRALAAKANRAIIYQAGRDVTNELVVNP